MAPMPTITRSDTRPFYPWGRLRHRTSAAAVDAVRRHSAANGIGEGEVMSHPAGDASKARFLAFFIDQLASLGLAIITVTLIPMDYPIAKGVTFVVMYVA